MSMAVILRAAQGGRFSIPDRSGHLFCRAGRHPRPVADEAQPREVAQVLRRGGSAGHCENIPRRAGVAGVPPHSASALARSLLRLRPRPAQALRYPPLPDYASWLNRIEAQFTALRHFCLEATDHESHEAQAFLIRRYIAWRNRHAQDRMLREVLKRANPRAPRAKASRL
jgi:hypothetical protein